MTDRIRLTEDAGGLTAGTECDVIRWHGDNPLVRGAPGRGDTYLKATGWERVSQPSERSCMVCGHNRERAVWSAAHPDCYVCVPCRAAVRLVTKHRDMFLEIAAALASNPNA